MRGHHGRRHGHGHGEHGHHLVGDADDLRAVGFHHRKRQDGHERPAALGANGGVEDELVGAVEGHDEAAEVSEAMPASNEETWAESALSLMRAERLPWTASSAPRLASSTMVPEESTTKVAPALE